MCAFLLGRCFHRAFEYRADIPDDGRDQCVVIKDGQGHGMDQRLDVQTAIGPKKASVEVGGGAVAEQSFAAGGGACGRSGHGDASGPARLACRRGSGLGDDFG